MASVWRSQRNVRFNGVDESMHMTIGKTKNRKRQQSEECRQQEGFINEEHDKSVSSNV